MSPCKRQILFYSKSSAVKLVGRPVVIRGVLLLATILLITFICSVSCETLVRSIAATYSNGGVPLWLTGYESETNASSSITQRLAALIDRVGPNMRASADYRDFRDVRLNDSIESWKLLQQRMQDYASKQANLFGPKVKKLLAEANVSSDCLAEAKIFFDSIKTLKSWAVEMWSNSGSFPPVGFLDGQYSDFGSYKGCIDIKRPIGPKQTLKPASSYCVVGFRPLIPARPRFHLVFNKEPKELLGLFDSSSVMTLILSQAQYFHYVYLKAGVCVPSGCSAGDIQQVSKLIGRKLMLMSAPVKCFSWFKTKENKIPSKIEANLSVAVLANSRMSKLENNEPVFVYLNEPINFKQMISLVFIGSFYAIVLTVTLWHGVELIWKKFTEKRTVDTFDEPHLGLSGQDSIKQKKKKKCCDRSDGNNNQYETIILNPVQGNAQMSSTGQTKATLNSEQIIDQHRTFKKNAFYYFSMITNGKEFCDTSMKSNEIKCLHGFRVLTMLWIIDVHTLQYNDWSGFSRIYENVSSLQNPFVHPLINANYVVDNFFLMSGLLAAYTTWHSNKGTATNFSIFQSLFARYLRLTPQVLLISLMYIVLPLLADGGPFWYDMTHYAAKYCEKNWWVNLLHLQAFYREGEMCNLVGWWISVDMFYYAIGLFLLWLILNKRVQFALTCTSLFVFYCTIMTALRHYQGGFTPNNLGLVPQVNEVWSEFVVEFFWSPYPHAFVFFLGLWIGYLLANKIGIYHVRRWSRYGWFLSLASLTAINLSSRLWTTGAVELTESRQILSTSYNIICVIGWALSFAWMIVACHYGCAPLLDSLLANKLNVMLSKASFIIYLSHMLLLRTFYGTRYNLLEVSIGTISMLIVGMSFLSVFFGVFLCISFEGTFMKFQKLIVNKIRRKKPQLPVAGFSYASSNNEHQTMVALSEEKTTLNSGPTSVTLLK